MCFLILGSPFFGHSIRAKYARLVSCRRQKEVEEQRRRMTDLLRHIEDGQLNDQSNVATDRERLDAEHLRILELQQTIRDVDRNNKEAMKHTWAQLEDEHRAFLEEKIRVESDICARRQDRHRHIQCEMLVVIMMVW